MPNAAVRTIGFVGLGKMGAPMAVNAQRAGYGVVAYNRTVDRSAPVALAGARIATSVAAVAAEADVVVTCLGTVAACEAIYLASDGVIAHARPGTLLIEHSTITPALALRCAGAAYARGLEFVDAPVSGGPEGAEQGTLAIMVGGSPEAFERAESIMRAYGKTIRHVGSVGAGTQLKLVNQLLTGAHGAAAAEAIALAQAVGLDLDVVMDVLRASFGYSRMLDRTMDRVRQSHYEAGAAISLFAKDLAILQQLGRDVGVPLPVASAVDALIQRAIEADRRDLDIAALRKNYPDAPDEASTR